MRQNLIFMLVIFIFIFSSCKKNHYKVNIGPVKAEVKIKRLEEDLFEVDPGEIHSKVRELRQKYNGFLQPFSYVINAGEITDSSFSGNLAAFCTDRQNNDIYALVKKQYPDVNQIEKEINDAFRHYLHYFPGNNLPAVYTCITGFNNSIIVTDSAIGIGLDRYLGSECEYYKRLGIYRYISAKMIPEYIVPDCIYGWASSEWDYTAAGYQPANVLASMVHEGKLKYFEKCLLPDLKDEILFGFTSDQMKFCTNNEARMWEYLVENNLLFKSDQFTIRKLTGEAPFTGYFSTESPGRAAVWLGFRIVESYMSRNPGTAMEDLMKDVDIQHILEKAKYNPK
jgi:hypothetical protein